jgi:hypothetical protein
MLATCFMLVSWLILLPWRRMRCVPPKRRLDFSWNARRYIAEETISQRWLYLCYIFWNCSKHRFHSWFEFMALYRSNYLRGKCSTKYEKYKNECLRCTWLASGKCNGQEMWDSDSDFNMAHWSKEATFMFKRTCLLQENVSGWPYCLHRIGNVNKP